MKFVIRIALFHMICILFFSYVYFLFADEFVNSNSKNVHTYLDFLLLSTTVQCSVGLTDLAAISSISKAWLIFQHYVMLLSHVITLYIFTL
jgi:hypothetical protein